jgi:hypothetical protein
MDTQGLGGVRLITRPPVRRPARRAARAAGARADFEALLEVLDRDVVLRADCGAVSIGASLAGIAEQADVKPTST